MWQQDSHIFYTEAHSFYKEALHIFSPLNNNDEKLKFPRKFTPKSKNL